MQKKTLLGLIVSFTLIFSLTFCYAENTSDGKNETGKNMVQNAENTVQDAGKNAGNMVKGATNSIKNGAENLGNSVRSGLDATGNAMENGVNNVKSAVKDTFDNNTTNNNYTATRTSTEGTFMGMSSNTWSWLILGIAAIAIIALVWYYSVQLNNNHRNDNY